MGFGRWPVGGIRAWIHQPTRNFHCSQRIRTDGSSISFTFNSTLFPQYQNSPDPLHSSSVEKYGLDTEDPSLKTRAFQLKWETLLDSLSRDRPNPKSVWEAYCDLGSFVGFEKIPLRIHQQTLRKAVPPKERLGSIIAKRLQASRKSSAPHLYEGRLQTIIRNICESGFQPALDDYHFILAQFAAAAYPDGCRAVFHELVHRQKQQPTYKTYGLCLQAIAHRLTLPCPYRYLDSFHKYSSRMCFELLEDMSMRGIPLTSVNFDLTHRIFKATQNWTLYEYLLKVGYGVDLANPDCLSLEVQNQISSPTLHTPPLLSGTIEMPNLSRGFKTMPFSTAALNTLIDALGTRKETSRMVVAFEVLTNPLPKSTSSSSSSWPDDDEEEFVISTEPSYQYPSASPNTTTFVFLIRHMAKAKEVVFSRHYLKLASEIDRAESARLRNELVSRPPGGIIAPQLAITRAMVLPLYGLGNRMRHRPTLRWAYWMTRQAINDKREDLHFFSGWRDKHYRPLEFSDDDSAGETGLPGHDDVSNSTTSLPVVEDQVAMSSAQRHEILPSNLRVEFDSPVAGIEKREGEISGANSDLPKKPFQIDLHITLLERDIQQLEGLCVGTREALKRSTHRLKEKLGRRVWSSKDIFLASRERRVHVDRGEWMSIVGFGTSGLGKGMGNANSQTGRDLPRWMEEDGEGESGVQNAIT